MSRRACTSGKLLGALAAAISILAVRAPVAWGQEGELDLLLGGEQAETRHRQPRETNSKAAEPETAKSEESPPRPAEAEPQKVEAAKPTEAKPAVAKPGPAEGIRRQAIEEIVVTARKTEENLQDVPVAVTALTPETLEQTSTFDMLDLPTLVPNLVTSPGIGGQSTALHFQMRGQVQASPLGTVDPSVGFYDDGVYVARPHGANASFLDIKNVQVLRGPQGTLFGRNTTGGAILLSTNNPEFDRVSGTLGGSLGSFGSKTFHGVLNVPLLKDTLAFRLVGQTLSTDGFAFEETNQRKIATEGSDLLRAKLLYQPFESLSVLVRGQYIQVDHLGPPAKPLFALKPQQVQNPSGACCLAYLNANAQGVNYDSFVGGDPDRVHYDQGLKPVNKITVMALNVTGTWDQPWATVKVIGGLRKNEDVVNRIDIDGTPSTIIDALQENENREESAELQVTGSWFGDRFKWAAGAVTFDEHGKENGTTSAFIPVATAINPILQIGNIENQSIGGYAQATYSLTPKLRITGGLRYSWDDKRLVLQSTEGATCAIPSDKQDPGTNCQGTFDNSFDNTSFTAGTDYRFFENTPLFDDLLAYVSVTTGYRAGGQNLRGTSDATLAPFKPETLMQFEGGFKFELLDRRVRFNGAGFYTLYHDIQRDTIVSSNSVLPATVISNAASATIAGAELEWTALPPISGVDLGASLGITLPKYNEFTDATGDRSHEKFDYVATLSYALSGGYTREILGVPWLNRLDWSWQDGIPFSQGNLKYYRDQGFDIEPLVTVPPTGILNARSSLTFTRGIELGLFGKNLTDERRFNALAFSGGPDFVTKFIWDPGRQLGLDVVYRF